VLQGRGKTFAGVWLWLAVLCVTETRGADERVLSAEAARVAVVEKAAPTVVAIFSPNGQGGGSGVLISRDGYALSNYHVTSACGDHMQCGLNNGELYDAVIVGIDPTGDVALLKLFGRDDFPVATLADSDEVRAGDWVYVMGNPFLLAADFQPTVTYGIVSGVHRYQFPAGTFLEYTDCIQVDASINPGNSGGPLFNARGELIGINGRGSFEKRGRVNSGAGYAISLNQIKLFLDALHGGRVVDHATLGATVSTRDDGAVVVDSILEQSEAYRRGLRDGDEILTFGGRRIGSVNQFKNILGIFPDGYRLPLTYRRDEAVQRIWVRLRRLHSDAEMLRFVGGPSAKPAEPAPPEGKKPERKPGEDKPDGQPPAPHPQMPGQPKAPPMPKALEQFFAKREGFANYHYNKTRRDAVLGGLSSFGPFTGKLGTWRMNGMWTTAQVAPVPEGEPVAPPKPYPCRVTLKDQGIAMEVSTEPPAVYGEFLEDKSNWADEPAGSGGLLIALHQFKLLLTAGTEGFDDFTYYGSESLDGEGEKVDVVVGVWRGVRSHWYFRRNGESLGGTLAGWDTYRAEDVDACEIRIPADALALDIGGKFPGRLNVSTGGAAYGVLEIQSGKIEMGGQAAR
jgi:serine protease Do